ncbi:MAG: hypothetical protein ACRDNF_00030 [Streptosporangiaceae bacterium]
MDSPGSEITAFESLASELDPAQYATAIITGTVSCLRVTNRQAAQLTEDIYAGRGWYWWSWAERITGCDDVDGAAAKIAHVLRAAVPVA